MNNKSLKHSLVLIIASLMAASSIGIMVNASGVFYTPISEGLNELRGAVAMHGMFQLFATATASLFVPKLLKRYPFKILIIISTIIACVATLLMGFATNVLMLNILATIRGIVSSVFGIVTVNLLINNWFFKMKGLALSIALSFSGIAGAIFAPVFTGFITSLGWEKSYYIMALVIFIIALPSMIIPFKLNPKDENLLPYGYEEDEVKEFNKGAIKPNQSYNFMQFGFIIMFIFAFINSNVTAIPQHLPGFALSIGMSASIGASMLSAAMYGNIGSKLLIGVISDIKGPVFASVSMLLVNIISIFIIMFLPTNLMLVVGAFLFGSIYSVAAVGLSLLTAKFFGLENYTQVLPILSFAGSSGGALGLPLFGYVYDFTSSYSLVFIIALIINVINIIIILYLSKTTSNNLKNV